MWKTTVSFPPHFTSTLCKCQWLYKVDRAGEAECQSPACRLLQNRVLRRLPPRCGLALFPGGIWLGSPTLGIIKLFLQLLWPNAAFRHWASPLLKSVGVLFLCWPVEFVPGQIFKRKSTELNTGKQHNPELEERQPVPFPPGKCPLCSSAYPGGLRALTKWTHWEMKVSGGKWNSTELRNKMFTVSSPPHISQRDSYTNIVRKHQIVKKKKEYVEDNCSLIKQKGRKCHYCLFNLSFCKCCHINYSLAEISSFHLV